MEDLFYLAILAVIGLLIVTATEAPWIAVAKILTERVGRRRNRARIATAVACLFFVELGPLREESYERSDAGKRTVDAIKVKVNRLKAQVDAHFTKPERTPAQWAAMTSSADKLRVSVEGAVTAVEPEGRSQLRAQLSIVQRMVDRLEGKLEPDAEGRLRRRLRDEILLAVEQIIQPYLAPDAYARVRKLLRDRIT